MCYAFFKHNFICLITNTCPFRRNILIIIIHCAISRTALHSFRFRIYPNNPVIPFYNTIIGKVPITVSTAPKIIRKTGISVHIHSVTITKRNFYRFAIVIILTSRHRVSVGGIYPIEVPSGYVNVNIKHTFVRLKIVVGS